MRTRRLQSGLAALICSVAAAAWSAQGGEIGPKEQAAVTLGCATLEGAAIIEFYGFISDTEARDACMVQDHRITAVWDDDWYGNPGNSPLR